MSCYLCLKLSARLVAHILVINEEDFTVVIIVVPGDRGDSSGSSQTGPRTLWEEKRFRWEKEKDSERAGLWAWDHQCTLDVAVDVMLLSSFK